MKVCLDCTPLLVRSAGVKTYLYYLREALLATADGREVVSFPYLDRAGPLRHEATPFDSLGNLARGAFATRLTRAWSPLCKWPLRGAKLFHASNLVRGAPGGVVLTTTVHDMTAFRFPELHTAQTIQADRTFFARIVARARRVIAVSNQTKQDLIAATGMAESKIRVIHPGVREEYFRDPGPDAEATKERHGLTRPYVLFVGTLEPRKNVARLAEAYAGLRASLREEYELVLVGMPGWLDREALGRLLAGGAGVRRLGYVAERDMPAITAGATVFAYPSLYEGFGFPVVEAMAAGVPVLTAAAGSLPEVAGEAACYVDPLSVDEIRTALERLLTSPSERRAMSGRGRAQARQYSWTEAAHQTWALFEEALEG